MELLENKDRDFFWATGIEDTFVPQVRPGLRFLDEYKLTQHYELWREDFDRLAETGVRAVRWGIPWHRVQPEQDAWDWRWTDEVLDYLVNVKGIIPILDLMHYGTPLWLDNSFINAGYPERVAEYAGRVAERYGSLTRYYTPFNEPMVCAAQCGYDGVWPPYLRGMDGYVKITMAVARGIIATVQALKAAQGDAVSVQVESLWHLFTQDERLKERVSLHNERQFTCFDLVTGRMEAGLPLWNFLLRFGAREPELAWFRERAVKIDFFGATYYPWGYGPAGIRKRTNGMYRRPFQTSGLSLADRLAEVYHRYQIPVILAETSALGDHQTRGLWMDETIEAVRLLRRQGIPVVGYSWFPFYSMVSWYYRTGRGKRDKYVIDLGLYDARYEEDGVFRRYPTPLIERYQDHMKQAMPPVDCSGSGR